MKILITGASGFLGSHLVEKFIDQHHIVILKRSFSDVWRISSLIDKLIVYDLDNLDLRCMFKKERIEAVIHLATNYGRNAESASKIVETNLLFPSNLFEAAIESGVNIFLNADTCSKDNGSFYFASKKAFSILLYSLYRKFKINVINLKLEYMYGPKDDDTKFIPRMIDGILNNNNINASFGLQKRDFVYVTDVVDAFKASLDLVNKSKENFINLEIGSGIPISFRTFAEKVEELTNKKGNIRWGKLPYRENEIFYSKANIRETQKKLDWSPTHNIEQGLAKTIDWYKG